jgi:hypothetical protein
LSRTAKLVLFLSFFPLPGALRAGHVELVSRIEPGAIPPGVLGTALDPSISADGRYVAFKSSAPNLVAGQIEVNDRDDVFLRDRDTGTITLVSHAAGNPVRTAGQRFPSYEPAPPPVISSDGRWVAFGSTADDLVPDQIDAPRNGSTYDVFLWDRQTGTTTLVSHAAGSPVTAGDNTSVPLVIAVSADAAFVAYTSTARNLVAGFVSGANNGEDIYLWSRATGENTLVSHAAGSPTTTGNQGSLLPSISADGRFVAFQSRATVLVPCPAPPDATDDVFLWDRTSDTMALVSHAAGLATTPGDNGSSQPALSADGSAVVFLSTAGNLVAGQTDVAGTADVFLFDRQTSTSTLVSHVAGAATTAARYAAVLYRPSISADASRVAYVSGATDLVAGQTNANGQYDVFLWNRGTGANALISHSAGAPATVGNADSVGAQISADGSHVAFLSAATDLMAGTADGNGALDLFSWDAATDTAALISHAAGSPLTSGNQATESAVIDSDGSSIAFSSGASDLAGPSDTNNGSDIFQWSAASGTNTPVSYSPAVTSATVPGLQGLMYPMSADGRYAIFPSSSPTVVAGQVDTNDSEDLFLVDRTAGTVTLVDHILGSPVSTPDRGARQGALSVDGRWVAYLSRANGIVPGTSSSNDKIYLYDRETGTTILVSHNGNSFGSCFVFCANPTISDDGRFVVYANSGNLISYDRLTDFDTLITHGPVSGSANWNHSPPRISGDGNSVVYLSQMTDLVPGQVDANNNGLDVFVWDRASDTNTLVSHLPGSPITTGNAPSSGRFLPEISRDGRWIVYVDDATDLIGGGLDGNNAADVFLFDRTTGSNSLVSRTASSLTTTANGESFLPLLSADGRWISFSSAATDLVSGVTDTNGTLDAFVLDRFTGAVSLVSHRAGAPAATGNADSGIVGISADGNSIALQTSATDLVAGVTDSNASADLVVIDRPSGFAELASRSLSSPAITANGWSQPLATFSAAGKVTLFYSYAPDLVQGDYNGDQDLFAYIRSFLDYYTLTPCRLLDTRQPQDGPALASGATVSLHPLGLCGIPPTARALSLNVTVLGGTGAGHVILFPGGTAAPETSALNFSAGATRANNAILSLGADGTLAVTPFVSGNGTVHVILDVMGYFQ